MARGGQIDVEALGKGIRERRLSLDMSQADLSARSGLAPSYISKLEKGQTSRPGAERLEALAAALRVASWRELLKPADAPAARTVREPAEKPPPAIAAHTEDGSELTDRELRLAHEVARIVIERLKREGGD